MWSKDVECVRASAEAFRPGFRFVLIWAFLRRTLENSLLKDWKKLLLGGDGLVLAHLFKIPGCIYPVIFKRLISVAQLERSWGEERWQASLRWGQDIFISELIQTAPKMYVPLIFMSELQPREDSKCLSISPWITFFFLLQIIFSSVSFS